MPKLAAMAALAAAMSVCAACQQPADDRSVLFAQCEKEKTHTKEGCQCVVDAQIANFDKDVLRVLVLRAQGRNGEADSLLQSIPDERSTAQTIKYAYAATECKTAGS